jgi:hypothetical protein
VVARQPALAKVDRLLPGITDEHRAGQPAY